MKNYWQVENNKGNGWSPCGHGPCECDCDVNSFTDQWHLLRAAQADDDVAVYLDEDGDYVLVADANGPWAQGIFKEDVK